MALGSWSRRSTATIIMRSLGELVAVPGRVNCTYAPVSRLMAATVPPPRPSTAPTTAEGTMNLNCRPASLMDRESRSESLQGAGRGAVRGRRQSGRGTGARHSRATQ